MSTLTLRRQEQDDFAHMSADKRKPLFEQPAYPFMIALAPVFSLYGANSTHLGPLDLIRPSIAHLALALVAFTFGKSVCKSNREAALLSAILVVSSIAYGHALKYALQAFGGHFVVNHILLIWIALTTTVFALVAILVRKSSAGIREITIIFNVFGLVVLIAALMPLLFFGSGQTPGNNHQADRRTDAGMIEHEWIGAESGIDKPGELPDFYYIITDAYARGDVLKSRFDFDNSDFTGWLERTGFFVGHQSHANYPWTHLSLSATLNAEYLQTLVPKELTENLPDDWRRRYLYIKQALANHYIAESRVHRFFSSLGYRFIPIAPGDSLTRFRNTSILQALLGSMNEFEAELLRRSIAQPALAKYQSSTQVSDLQLTPFGRTVTTLDNLTDAAEYPGPKFVFCYILSPHEPFAFARDGSAISPHPVYDSSPWLSDKIEMPGYLEWVKKNYPQNVEGLNHHLKNAIEEILESTQRNAVIIIQSDHGSSLGLNPAQAAGTDMLERFGILNAVFIPPKYSRKGLDQRVSSINTFPILLNNVFNLNIERLEDRAFYSRGDLEFLDVTSRIRDF